jgi:hypothetical protein
VRKPRWTFLPVVGSLVSVIIEGAVHPGRVTRTSVGYPPPSFEVLVAELDWWGAGHFLRGDEGLTWCEGWDGKQVDALKVVAAL